MLNVIDATYKNDNGKTVNLRIFEKDEHGFLDKRYLPVAEEQKNFEKRISEIDKEISEKKAMRRTFEKEKNYFHIANIDSQLKELLAKREELEKTHNETIKKLLSTDVFTNESQKPFSFESEGYGFSLREENGFQIIDESTVRVPLAKPNITTVAEELPEGGTPTPKDIREDVDVLRTDDAEIIRFTDITGIGLTAYNDDKTTFDDVFNYLHKVHLINAENKKAFYLMYTAKAPLSFTPENLQESINAHLCGAAKQKAVIVTNKAGFAKIDKDINGTPLVTKDNDGFFVYKNKYRIVEMADEILPNDEADRPRIIIGDLSVVRFFIVQENRGHKDDLVNYAWLDKVYKKEILALSTNSDSSFIVGTLA